MPTGHVPPQGDAVCWETLVNKFHICKFSWSDASLWCSVQLSLCCQRGSSWKWFGPPMEAIGLMYVATQVSLMLLEGNKLSRARDATQNSLPHCVGSTVWRRGEGYRPQLYSTGHCSEFIISYKCSLGS